YMAELAMQVAAESGGTIITTVLERDECAALGMNAFLAVAKGSKVPPKFIIMDYAPAQCSPNGPVLGLVGKSVTFDSGGLDIKPADGMRDMKYDMCGGADVIAAMRAIARLGLPIRVKAYCAATENMTGDEAYRPGDVYTSIDGRSYEIDNTDAEGRLTLVDAISYARIHGKVTHLVDYATLTGAILVALGDITAGVFSNNQAFADQYLAAAGSMGEDAFQMPTSEKYKALNKSTIADMKNAGGRFAGSITAALFVLSAARDLPAIHVDIAGVSFRGKEVDADPAGGTGWGVRTLVALAANLAKTA
ncbi:MAG: aminopeptidase, partial [Candidatus Melainabacteria bacterium]|nr:aminopeptidase [Candidatus Melainabacteria bacterium]